MSKASTYYMKTDLKSFALLVTNNRILPSIHRAQRLWAISQNWRFLRILSIIADRGDLCTCECDIKFFIHVSFVCCWRITSYEQN